MAETVTQSTRRQRAASIAGRARAASMTPEQRKAQASKGHLASAVAAVVNRAPDLTPEQLEKLRAVFGGASE